MQSQSILAAMLLTHLVHVVAYLGVGGYAVSQRKRHPTASRYLLLAVVIMGVSRGLSFLTPVMLSRTVTPAQLGSLILMVNVVFSLLDLVAFGLMAVAVFIKRLPESPQASDGALTPGPSSSSDNPYESPQ